MCGFVRRAAGVHQRYTWKIYKSIGGAVVYGPDDLLHFGWGKGAVFIVEAVPRTVGRGHVELHSVDVLTQNVSGSAHLEIID